MGGGTAAAADDAVRLNYFYFFKFTYYVFFLDNMRYTDSASKKLHS